MSNLAGNSGFQSDNLRVKRGRSKKGSRRLRACRVRSAYTTGQVYFGCEPASQKMFLDLFLLDCFSAVRRIPRLSGTILIAAEAVGCLVARTDWGFGTG